MDTQARTLPGHRPTYTNREFEAARRALSPFDWSLKIHLTCAYPMTRTEQLASVAAAMDEWRAQIQPDVRYRWVNGARCGIAVNASTHALDWAGAGVHDGRCDVRVLVQQHTRSAIITITRVFMKHGFEAPRLNRLTHVQNEVTSLIHNALVADKRIALNGELISLRD